MADQIAEGFGRMALAEAARPQPMAATNSRVRIDIERNFLEHYAHLEVIEHFIEQAPTPYEAQLLTALRDYRKSVHETEVREMGEVYGMQPQQLQDVYLRFINSHGGRTSYQAEVRFFGQHFEQHMYLFFTSPTADNPVMQVEPQTYHEILTRRFQRRQAAADIRDRTGPG